MTPDQRMVVLTRDEAGNQAWSRQLVGHGLNVYQFPCVQTGVAELTPQIEQALTSIRDFHWIIFSTPQSVQYFLELSVQLGLPLRTLTGAWIATPTLQAADVLKSLGLVVNFVPSRQNPATLAQELKRVKSRRILYLRTDPTPPKAVDSLRRRSATVTDLPIFQHVPLETPDLGFNQLLRDGDIGRIVFSSPTAVTGFAQRISDPVVLELARNLPVTAIGPEVTTELERIGFSQVHTAPEPSISAIIQAPADV